MKTVITAAIVCLAALAVAAPAGAEFYKYLDEQGNVRYTDDLNEVPLDQREGLETYEEYVGAPETDARQEEPTDQEMVPKRDLDAAKADLDARQQELAIEYQALEARKAKLVERRQSLKTDEEIQAYNEEINQLKLLNEQYKQRVQDYNRAVEAYNRQLSGEDADAQAESP